MLVEERYLWDFYAQATRPMSVCAFNICFPLNNLSWP